MPDYQTPGVFIEELPQLPLTITSVETAVPVFIGHTCQAQREETGDLLNVPVLIRSLQEYEQFFGGADSTDDLELSVSDPGNGSIQAVITKAPCFLLYYSLRMFFSNGGKKCYIVSVADYAGGQINAAALEAGLEIAGQTNGITLIIFPDSMGLPDAESYYTLHQKALQQCARLHFRMVIMDVYRAGADWQNDVAALRTLLPDDIDLLKYGAAYFPRILSTVDLAYTEDNVKLHYPDGAVTTLSALKSSNNALYYKTLISIGQAPLLLPASPAIAGVYSETDDTRGVWKSPANIPIEGVIDLEVRIGTNEQEELNVDIATGKSINVIRDFPGRGKAIVWGARTLAGNDHEWRYISVRRFINMVEESVYNATQWVTFEPNDNNTWVKLSNQVEHYLYDLWRSGALNGIKPEHAFYVRTGLHQTMTNTDILEGRLIVEIGMAVVRPAEFVVLKFSHTMLGSS
jgi:phage tail sheath protein FI